MVSKVVRPLAFHNRATFAFIVLAAVALKLWLTSGIRLLPEPSPYDAVFFIGSAKNILTGHWLGDYNVQTLTKQPFFPIFLAGIQEFGLPLTLAHQILYAFACAIACIAMRPLIRNTFALGAVFLLTYFNPFTFGSLAWLAYRSQLNDSLALLVVACAVGLLVRKDRSSTALMPWLLGLGFSLGTFWLTREEAIWIVPSVVLIVGFYVYSAGRNVQGTWHLRLLTVTVPLLTFVLTVGTVMLINGVTYDWFVTSEQQAPELLSAYGALERIVVPGAEQRVPIPRAARELAYRVSPAARELRAYLEGPSARMWIHASCDAQTTCTDIGAGHIIWAFRGAAASAGHYVSGQNTRAFYVQLANEIDSACDSRTIVCRAKLMFPLAPHVGIGDLPSISSAFTRGAWYLASFTQLWLGHAPPLTPNLSVRDDYEFVAGSVYPADSETDHAKTFDEGFKLTVLQQIAKTYQQILPWWIAFAFALTALRLARLVQKRSARVPPQTVFFIAAVTGASVLIGLLAVLDALAFHALNEEYYESAVPLLLYALATTTLIEGGVFGRLMSSRRRGRSD